MRSLQTDKDRSFGRAAVIAVIGLAAVTVGLVLALVRWPEEAAPPPPTAVGPTAPAPALPPNVALAPAPSFDVARISREGDTVIAGRAAPGSTVDILGNGEPLGRVTADQNGEWVFVPEAPLPPGAHRLTLSMQRAGEAAVAGDGEVLVIVPDAGKDIAGRGGQAASRPPLALLVPGSGDRAPAVLQKPGSGDVAASIAIDVFDYGSDGRLAIAGRAQPNAEVRIMLDGNLLGSATADATGAWSLTRRQVQLTGSHRLEAEEIDPRGAVAGRFVGRLQLAPPATAQPAGGAAPGSIVVEPGQNLWRIARHTYGQGYAYTIIFDANRARIDDPDLIYPGQVFVLPPAPAASGN